MFLPSRAAKVLLAPLSTPFLATQWENACPDLSSIEFYELRDDARKTIEKKNKGEGEREKCGIIAEIDADRARFPAKSQLIARLVARNYLAI